MVKNLRAYFILTAIPKTKIELIRNVMRCLPSCKDIFSNIQLQKESQEWQKASIPLPMGGIWDPMATGL